ncbi:hypothetical protein VNO78_07374 [Psophocarpus tetragonolobus]|uniref:Cytochrome P450 n=1 Tax=Psophocarpus tetragonolobus TaxID=3891 RepID=A0AAN9SU44_PSOTE
MPVLSPSRDGSYSLLSALSLRVTPIVAAPTAARSHPRLLLHRLPLLTRRRRRSLVITIYYGNGQQLLAINKYKHFQSKFQNHQFHFHFSFLKSILSPKFKTLTLPPGPTPLRILGNLFAPGARPHHSLAKLTAAHGPIMALRLGRVTTVVISSADAAREVLQTHDLSLSNRTVPDALSVLNHHQYSLSFMRVSPRWRDLRKICNNQLFANKTLDNSQVLRRNKLQDLLSDIKKASEVGEAVDIGRAAFKTIINLLSNTFFSANFVHSTAETGEYKEIVVSILKEPNISDFFPALKVFDLQGIRKRSIVSVKKASHDDVLDALLNISQENGKIEMDKDEIEHLLLNIFKELWEVVGKGNPVEETDIARLPYLNAVIKETFRVHPPVPLLLPRKAETDVEIGGYTIPKDAQVLVHAWVIGRDPEKWDSPNVFLPERFLDTEIDIKGHHFELIPFGSGRRICPGLPLAIRMLPLMLGSLVNCFHWKLEEGIKLDDLDKEDEYGITLEKSQPVRIVPVKLGN